MKALLLAGILVGGLSLCAGGAGTANCVARTGIVIPLPEKRPPLGWPISYHPLDWGSSFFGYVGMPFRNARVGPGDVGTWQPVAFVVENGEVRLDSPVETFRPAVFRTVEE